MTDVERWSVLILGTGLGNARFTNRAAPNGSSGGNSKYSAQPRHSRGRDSGRDAGNRRAANPVASAARKSKCIPRQLSHMPRQRPAGGVAVARHLGFEGVRAVEMQFGAEIGDELDGEV